MFINTSTNHHKEYMTQDEAKTKTCPIMSRGDNIIHCIASECMLWAKMLKNGKKSYTNLEFMSVLYYDGERRKLSVEGYCGLLGDKPPFLS